MEVTRHDFSPQVRKKIGTAEVAYFHQSIKGVDFVFVDHPSYPRAPGGIYSDQKGPYNDNQVCFGYLPGWPPGKPPKI